MAIWDLTLPFTAPKKRLTVSRLNEGKRAATELHDSYFSRATFKGLRLKTVQAASSSVHLLAAEEIVMNDGTVVTGWQNLTADKTVGGVGGLDTGVPTASKWYEIYAISKAADNTKGMLLHRAREYFLDEAQDVSDTFIEINGGASPTTRVQVAQGFQVDTTGACPFVEIFLKRIGTLSNAVAVQIQTDNAGSPSGVVVGSSESILSANISTVGGWYRFYFRSLPSLGALTQYHLVAFVSSAGDASNYLQWWSTATVPYTRGTTKISNGTTWTAQALDQNFHVYIITESAITLPSGYDRYCRIGFVYNSSGNVLQPFWQVDRNVTQPQVALLSGTNTFPALATWPTIMPPVTVMAKFSLSNSVADQWVAISPPASPIFASSEGAIIGTPNVAGIGIAGPMIEVYCEAQANYVFTQSGTFQVYSAGYRW